MVVCQVGFEIIPLSYRRIEKLSIIFVLEFFNIRESVQIINLGAEFIMINL